MLQCLMYILNIKAKSWGSDCSENWLGEQSSFYSWILLRWTHHRRLDIFSSYQSSLLHYYKKASGQESLLNYYMGTLSSLLLSHMRTQSPLLHCNECSVVSATLLHEWPKVITKLLHGRSNSHYYHKTTLLSYIFHVHSLNSHPAH